MTQVKQEQLVNVESAAELPDRSQADQIENRVLVRQLLETLFPQDREIFLRRMAGEMCPEIDSAMNLNRAQLKFDSVSASMLCRKFLRRGSIEKRTRVAGDPIGGDNPIEDILLIGFPNPEGKGCSPPEVIEALGNRQLGRDHQIWQHMWSCSPCFRDFKEIRDARLAGLSVLLRSKRTRRNFIAAAAASAFAGARGYFLVSNNDQSRRAASPYYRLI